MPHKDPAARAAYLREWKQAHRGRYKTYNKAYDAARHANERADRYGAPGVLTAAEAAALLAVGRCHYCGSADGWLGLDHVVPLVERGPNRPDNIVAACHACNSSKFRGDRPGRWARDHENCVACRSTERPHICHGLCSTCYSRARKAKREILT